MLFVTGLSDALRPYWWAVRNICECVYTHTYTETFKYICVCTCTSVNTVHFSVCMCYLLYNHAFPLLTSVQYLILPYSLSPSFLSNFFGSEKHGPAILGVFTYLTSQFAYLVTVANLPITLHISSVPTQLLPCLQPQGLPAFPCGFCTNLYALYTQLLHRYLLCLSNLYPAPPHVLGRH